MAVGIREGGKWEREGGKEEREREEKGWWERRVNDGGEIGRTQRRDMEG